MEMETLVFKPNPRHTALWQIGGLLFAGAGCTFMCLFGLMTAFMLTIGAEKAATADSNPSSTALMFSAGICLGVVFVVAGLFLTFRPRKERLTLTPEALVIFNGKTETRLPLVEITSLQAVRRVDSPGSPAHWGVRIESRFERPVELDISSRGFLAQFDMQPVLQNLLPRLPDEVQVDPRLKTYAETGKIS